MAIVSENTGKMNHQHNDNNNSNDVCSSNLYNSR